MDLPIDHFRLLGVSTTSDAQTVLRTLAQRLDRVPDQGFTTETLQARARLLHDSAELLSDSQRRHAYECELTAVAEGPAAVPALDIPTPLEVASLLLLLEAGQPQEAFDLACRALQPPQAPALGSSREADLSLLAALACLASAQENCGRRHFEAAVRQLRQGLQLLQRMGQLPEMRQKIAGELEQLTPYLVLDLLSRELTASEKRQEGLELLEQLVSRRGGLEGERDPSFGFEEFQAFFKQIRGFLTVQEQVDLFIRWADSGSETADFLAVIVLTASGFAQRKPERIAAARERLQASGRTGAEPLLANLLLLLGDVDEALELFAHGASPEIREWVEAHSADPLAQLCAYCRDWLANTVLPGYRDLEADPDLDAYFADRDVIAWVEREDRRSGRHLSRPVPSPGASEPGPMASWPDLPVDSFAAPMGVPDELPFPADAGDEEDEDDVPPPQWRLPSLRRRFARAERGEPSAEQPQDAPIADGLLARLLAGGLGAVPPLWRWLAGISLALAAAVAVIQLRPRPSQVGTPVPLPVQPARSPEAAAPARPAPPLADQPATAPTQPVAPAAPSLAPLTVAAPDQGQLRQLLQSWLQAKVVVMAGGDEPAGLDAIARDREIGMLRQKRAEDAAAGRTQTIDVSIETLDIVERSPQRIEVLAKLRYSDQRLDAAGKPVPGDRTTTTTLSNTYVFGRDGDRWRVAALK